MKKIYMVIIVVFACAAIVCGLIFSGVIPLERHPNQVSDLNSTAVTDTEDTETGTESAEDEKTDSYEQTAIDETSELSGQAVEDMISDSLQDMDGNVIASYLLPADTTLTFAPDNTKYSSEKWYDMEGDIDLFLSTDSSDMYSDASEYIKKSAEVGDKKVTEILEIEVEGKHWYYYTYTTANVSKEKTKVTYHFRAATDLENGIIFKIQVASENPDSCEVDTYRDILGNVTP